MHTAASQYKDKNVLVLGAARTGVAVCHLLAGMGAILTLIDDNKPVDEVRSILNDLDIEVIGSGYKPAKLSGDFLVLSPGIPDTHPLVASCKQRDIPIFSEIEIAGRVTQAPIVAVTGSNGKSTVTTLIHEMLAASDFRSFIGGNIGLPFSFNVFEELQLQPINPVQVVEISSFQAEHLSQFAPLLVVYLNLSADHMDRYSDMTAYGQAKLMTSAHLAEGGKIVYNHDDEFFSKHFGNRDHTLPFSMEDCPDALYSYHDGWIYSGRNQLIASEDILIPGPHNLSNILAAATAAHQMGATDDAIKLVAARFTGLRHRLELAGEIDGVKYYNDSKATNVASARVALASFTGNIILILGGSDKGATDYIELADLIKARVKFLITYGEIGMELTQLFRSDLPLSYHQDFSEAVDTARDHAVTGDVVLLSPACASFDQFSDFEARGDYFKQIVRSYMNAENHV